ncbi:MAG: hypothetical protein MJE68_14255, partial [Proteobacteria bacterium]|nr:hypothetical protein [Pseudomonadota bacterium]
ISAHPPILAQCKVHRPWALFHEGTVYTFINKKFHIINSIMHETVSLISLSMHMLSHFGTEINNNMFKDM